MNLRIAFEMLTTALFGGPRAVASVVLGDQQLMQDVAALLAEGAIWPVVAARYPLAQVVEAHAALERGPQGTVVVSVADAPRHDGRRRPAEAA